MRLLQSLVIVSSLTVAVESASAGDGYVGIYLDPAGTIACTTIPAFTGTTLYVVAKVAGNTASGIVGAEFRVEVTQPAGWFFSYNPPSGSTPLGTMVDLFPANDLDGSGLNIAFAACQTPSTEGAVGLGTLSVFNAGGSPTSLLVKRHSRPSNANFPCPLFTVCDGPQFSSVCMTAGSEPPCSFAKAVLSQVSGDIPVFASGLNAPEVSSTPDPSAGNEVASEVFRKPTLIADPGQPDIESAAISPPASKTQSDTAWVADWSFDSGSTCAMTGWQRLDNRVLNNGQVYWSAVAGYDGLDGSGGVTGKAAVLRSSNPCWVQNPGYGNDWDQSLRVSFEGAASTLSFDYIVDCESSDGLSVEVDFGCNSSAQLDESDVPTRLRVRLPNDASSFSGSVAHARITVNTCQSTNPASCSPQEGTTNGCWYIRFWSDDAGSDEDGKYLTAMNAGLIIDNITVTGGLPYSEDFENQTWSPYVVPVNSAPTRPAASTWNTAPWSRVFNHITDNDQCTENGTCAWLFTDPIRIASIGLYPFMGFGPGQAVIHSWLDEIIVSPWVALPSNKPGTVLRFREFPGNPFEHGRVVRNWSVRGIPSGSTCASPWSNSAQGSKGTWQDLGAFSWVDRALDITPFVEAGWGSVQVRFRVADWQYLYGGSPPAVFDPGPGPYIDRVRIGRFAVTGPVLNAGEDTRSQAQDTFSAGTPLVVGDVWGSCSFGSSGFLRGGSGAPDSIFISARDRRGSPIATVTLYAAIVAGPHAGKAPAPYTVGTTGFFAVGAEVCRTASGAAVAGLYFVDLDDDYFRGGDVVRYFWLAIDQGLASASLPPGLSSPIPNVTQAEAVTGGLFEVNFLPTISWSSTYLARVAADAHGKLTPTTEEKGASPQTNCILYVNKVNTSRRSGRANRTSFMYTLDTIGYTGNYDVYDVQGFGNVSNDLASRARPDQAIKYSLIIHDAGTLHVGALPDGSDLELAPLTQDAWYQSWLGLAGMSVLGKGAATLWLIGENIASTTRHTVGSLLGSELGLGGSQIESAVILQGTDATIGHAAPFRFIQANGYALPKTFVDLRLTNVCPQDPDYDGVSTMSVGFPQQEVAITNKYGNQGMVLMSNRAFTSGVNGEYHPAHQNIVLMTFPWNAILRTTTTGPSPTETLARSIVSDVLGGGCGGLGTTDTDQEPEGLLPPLVTRLYANYPNPCNPSTQIQFDIATKTQARLRVYDVSGRLVRVLHDRQTVPGQYRVAWDGRNDQHAVVASGVYVYRFEAGEVSQSRKMVVVR